MSKGNNNTVRKLGGVPPRWVETAIAAADGNALRLAPIKSGLAQGRFPAEIWCGRWRSLSRVRRPADEGNPHAGSRQGLFLLSGPFLYLALASGGTLTLRWCSNQTRTIAFVPLVYLEPLPLA